MTFVEVYKPHKEYGAVSAGKFPLEHIELTGIGVEVFDASGPTYTKPDLKRIDRKILYLFPWTSVVRLEYSEGEA